MAPALMMGVDAEDQGLGDGGLSVWESCIPLNHCKATNVALTDSGMALSTQNDMTSCLVAASSTLKRTNRNGWPFSESRRLIIADRDRQRTIGFTQIGCSGFIKSDFDLCPERRGLFGCETFLGRAASKGKGHLRLGCCQLEEVAQTLCDRQAGFPRRVDPSRC